MATATTVEQSVDASYDVVPSTRFRRVTARRMKASASEKPHVTLHTHAPVDALMSWRSAERARDATSAVTVTTAVVALVARVLAQHNRLNGRVEEDEVRLYADVNLAVAVDTPDGLVAPVVQHADRRDLGDLADELRRLADASRDGRLRPEDVADATFTITNLGAFGVELFTPIINPPQLAILGIGAITLGLVEADGEIVPTRMLGLSLSFDHAAGDGADGARLMSAVVAAIGDPGAWLSGSAPA